MLEPEGCMEPLPPLPKGVCQTSLDCPLGKAPGCFSWQLKRELERAGMGHSPCGLSGFKDHFCRGYAKSEVATAVETVDWWMDNCEKSTIGEVLLFAEEKHNLPLTTRLHQTLLGHIKDGHSCTRDPANCFTTCDHCTRGPSTPEKPREGNSNESSAPTRSPSSSSGIDVQIQNITHIHLPPAQPPSPIPGPPPNNEHKVPADDVTLPPTPVLLVNGHVTQITVESSGSQHPQANPKPPADGNDQQLNNEMDEVHPGPTDSAKTKDQSKDHEHDPPPTMPNVQLLPPTQIRRRHPHEESEAQGQQKTEENDRSTPDPPPDLCTLFTSRPYNFLQCLKKNDTLRHVVVLFYLVMFVYHFLAMMLVTMCEDGGFQNILSPQHNTPSMIIHRIVMFGLRIIGRIVTPGFCLAQLHMLASSKKPKVSKALWRTVSEKEEMGVGSMLMVVLHTVFFMGFLLYLGAFFLAEERIVMEGVCNFEVVNSATFYLPWVNVQIFLMLFVESVSIFLILLLVAVTTEFYEHENKTIRELVRQRIPRNLFDAIRDRWAILDLYCYLIPVILTIFVCASFAIGRPFTPNPPRDIKRADFNTWYFWVFILSALTLLASSRHTVFKCLCIITNIFAVMFAVYITRQAGAVAVEPISASIVVLLFTTVASHAANILYSLGKCHLRYWWTNRKNWSSFAGMIYCFTSIVLLAVLCLATGIREVLHLWQFVAKQQ